MASTLVFIRSVRYCSFLVALIALVLTTQEISGVNASVPSKNARTGGVSIDNLVNGVMGLVSELGHIMKEVRGGVEHVANGIQNVEDVLDATFDEECVYQCPDGQSLQPKSDYVPTSNGCGTFGLEKYLTEETVPFLSKFADCCDEHDICYGTCANDKDICDLKFKKCVYKKCTLSEETLPDKLKNKGCKASAKLLYTGTSSLGCKPYINAQQEACLCQDKEKAGRTREKEKPEKDEF